MIDDELKKKIINHYQKGQGSIQDIARVYRLTVPEVLGVLGLTDLTTVSTGGDLIDPSEAGPGATMNYGKQHQVPFTTD